MNKLDLEFWNSERSRSPVHVKNKLSVGLALFQHPPLYFSQLEG